jgi:hypothetical protein
MVAEPALRIISVGQDRANRRGDDRGDLAAEVEDGAGGEQTALGEDYVCSNLHSSFGLCILKKKDLKPYIRAKAMPARM